ncbi:hypothetical protein BV20DRAFT_546281 [Pilatotrama ljubarskyi]|nr:hypothetical protein BV20DRAFT_546281 [Pilatotrama ljubarskyi]
MSSVVSPDSRVAVNLDAIERLAFLPEPPALDDTFGALLIGTFCGLILFGITLHQGYRYFRYPAYDKDSVFIKGTVAIVLILETFHTALALHVCYYYLVTKYFQPLALLRGTWSANFQPALTGLIVAVTQAFFARRIFLLNRRYFLVVVVALALLLSELGFSIACSVEAFILPDIFEVQKLQWLSIVALALIIGADTLLTGVLTFILCRSRTGFKSTDSVLNILIFYTINNGLLIETLSIISLFMAIYYPHSLITDGLNICIAKAYANSLLSVLNHRHFLRNHGKQTAETGLTTGSDAQGGFHNTDGRFNAQVDSQPVLHIKVTRETHRDTSTHTISEDVHSSPDNKINRLDEV